MSNTKRYLITFKDTEIGSMQARSILGADESKFKEGISFMATDATPSEDDVVFFSSLGLSTVELSDAGVDELRRHPDVLAVEEDQEVHILGIRAEEQEAKVDTVASQEVTSVLWNMAMVNAPAAWADSNNGSGVNLAILDTGIAQHPDLVISDGVSFVPGVPSYNDGNGHGTHCAGIAAARYGLNDVYGVAKNADLYAVKVLSDAGQGRLSWVIAGMEWCIENGIKVASMSLVSKSTPSVAMATAVKKCQDAGVVVVMAAGNSYDSSFPWVNLPANSCISGDPNSSPIAVGAIDSGYTIATFSSRGAQTDSSCWNPVTLSAPGVAIYSTYLNDGYTTMSGTSMACPHVAGLAALVIQANPNFTVSQVKATILGNTVPLGTAPYPNEAYGSGVISCVPVVYLKCLGSDHNPDHVFLNGLTPSGGVNLAANTSPVSFSGTQWQKIALEDGSLAFRSLGNFYNPKHLFLDGMTQNGSVGLVPNTNSPWTGTHWQEETLSDDSKSYKCLGSIVNKEHQYLDGLTASGAVQLAPETGGHYSGTHWEEK